MKNVIMIPYNAEEDADGKPIETWKDFNLFRTGNRTVLKNISKGCRIVFYDTQRGVIAECKLVKLVDMKIEVNDDSAKRVYNILVKFPLYPFDYENMYDSIENYPIHIFYDDFRIYKKIISIEDMEKFSSKSLRHQNGIIIEDGEGFDNFLKEQEAI